MYKLLIVDDESIIRKGIKNLTNLSKIGISEILEAENGREAIDIVDKEKPDIVIMDINMPFMDGLTASTYVKDNYPEIFVVILTGYDYFEYAQSAIRANVDDYILKPVSKKDVEIILTRITQKIEKSKKQKEFDKLKKSNDIEIKVNEKNMYDLTEQVQKYIKEHMYDKDLSLHKMASDMGFNSSYLSIVVKQALGIPFQEYVNKNRMEKAKMLLLTTSMKNYEVAESIGIDDVNYFVTKFKKTWGITPKQYKQGVTSNDD